MDAVLTAPVALFVFNRPEPTRRVLDAVAAARPARLLVVADGPRPGRAGEAERCREVRAMFEQVDWPCEVLTDFSPVNLGCRRRIASGLEWVFSRVDSAIVLEDDCLPEPSFFRFCDEMLLRYRDDERIHMVRGSNLLRGARFGGDSYYFSRFYNIWGWATWARAFHGYDAEMRQWPALRDSGWLERRLPRPGMARLVRHLFDETHGGRLDTWDYQWALLGWLHDRLAIVPSENLVTNIGHGAGATHTHHHGSHLAQVPTAALPFPLRHPATVAALDDADLHEWKSVYPDQPIGWWPRLRRAISRRAGRR